MGIDPREFDARREHMIKTQIRARGVRDPEVLDALRIVPRHKFMEKDRQTQAYEDHPVPIGQGQTISQPYIVAFMTEALQLAKEHKVLEIGAGCGYQTAVLQEISARVYSLEIRADLVSLAKRNLDSLGYSTNTLIQGNGYDGWAEKAPFDRILVAAAAPSVPSVLLDQLAEGGVMVIPVGNNWQELIRVEKKKGGIAQENLLAVRFVPLVHHPSEF